MRIEDQSRLGWRQASRLLAFVSAIVFVVLGTGFAFLIPAQFEEGNVDGARWFALSAFPLMIVIWIAVFTRAQRRLDQKHGRKVGSYGKDEWPYS